MGNFHSNHVFMFIVLYLNYGSSYLLRMPLGVVKTDLMNYYNVSVKSLGFLDLAFLLPYAFISLMFGGFIESSNCYFILFLCSFVSGISSLSLPFCKDFSLLLFFVFIIGSSQSLGWPASCCLISRTFENSRSSIFGIFGTCCFAGGIIGKCLAVYLKSRFSLTAVFIIPSVVVLSLSFVILIFSKYYPSSGGMDEVEKSKSDIALGKITTWKIFLFPGVLEVSLTMLFVKAIRYTFLFWLPLFLNMKMQYSSITAGYVSLSFDIGGVFGSFFTGFISDKCMKGKDMLICCLTLLATTLGLIFIWYLQDTNLFFQFILLSLVGSFNGGSDVILCGAIAAKLGKRYERNGIRVSLITGIVNGMGSLGTVIEGPLVAYAYQMFGWSSILPLTIAMSIISSFLALKAVNSLK